MTTLDQWHATWRGLGAQADDAVFQSLSDRYREKHRHYHTVQHLDECLAWMPAVTALAQHAFEIELALWFHDAIYDVKRQDNEERSAEWAKSVVLDARLAPECADRVHALIMMTRHNAVPDGVDAQILVDIDLSILGAPASRFDEYERQVRAEYGWVPGVLFRRTRRKILEAFAARPRLYSTAPFVERCEAQARENLARSIAMLGG